MVSRCLVRIEAVREKQQVLLFPHLSGEGCWILCQLSRLLLLPAGPQLQAVDRSVPRRTSTASSGPKCSHRTSTASSRSQCSLPDLNSNLWIKVIPAGPEQQPLDQSDPRRTPTASSRLPSPQALDYSVPRRTSTASSGSECSPPDFQRKLRIKVFPAGPQPQAPDQSVPRRTSTTKNLRRYTG